MGEGKGGGGYLVDWKLLDIDLPGGNADQPQEDTGNRLILLKEKNDLFAKAEPVIGPGINLSREPIIIEGGVEIGNFFSQKACFRRTSPEGLDNCQDDWGIAVDESSRTIVGADGVGASIFGGQAAERVCLAIVNDFNASVADLLPIDPVDIDTSIESASLPKIHEEAIREKVKAGEIAASTIVAARVERSEEEYLLKYRFVGDGGIVVARLGQRRTPNSEIVFSMVAPAEQAPSQVIWDQKTKSWILAGEEKSGSLIVRRDDIVIIFSDGLLTQPAFRGSSAKQVFQNAVGKANLRATTMQVVPSVVVDELISSGEGNFSDDVFVGAMAV